VSVSLDYRLGPANTFSIGGGAGLSGRLAMSGSRYEISPGWLFTASYSRLLLDGRGAAPFLLFGASFGGSGASTRAAVPFVMAAPPSVSLYAIDLRLGLTVGKTFWNVLRPYAAVRAFGGPVIWKINSETRNGTDRRHFQLAAGLSSSLPRGVDLYAEIAPLGERAVTLGGGVAF
jgi:hypothetical protein